MCTALADEREREIRRMKGLHVEVVLMIVG
jgi:hypothetical protein